MLGSVVIGGLLLLSLLGFYGNATDHGYQQTFGLLTLETATSLLEIMEYDLQRVGANVPNPTLAIVSWTDTTLAFVGDVTGDGIADTVRYYLSDPSAATGTPNPNDRILYREVNGAATIQEAFGVRAMNFVLRDELGAATTNPAAARTIEVQLRVESTISHNGRYATAYVQKRITPARLVRPSHLDF
jgi:hypothetical protein